MAGKEPSVDYGQRFPSVPDDGVENQAQKATEKRPEPKLPIFSILDSIEFSEHFVIIGDVGTGKSTVTPIREYELCKGKRQIIIREPSRAACNALFYSLQALHPELEHELAVITKDTKINLGGKIKIVTDGVLLRMLAENSIHDSSIYFDESHQMTSQLELCMSLAKKEEASAGNLFRVMSATIDAKEFLPFLGISKLYRISGRRYHVTLEMELADDLDGMFKTLSHYFDSQPRDESWLVFLPTRRLVEKYASSYGGVYIHGGLEGSEVNRMQHRAEQDKNLRIFATNVIASSVNIYVDNVLIFDDVIDSKDKLGQKTLHYNKIDNNSLLQMIGRIGRFKPGRAVILTDAPLPKKINPIPVRKALENETPFDLVLLMSKYGLKLPELEFMSKVDHREVAFAENWLVEIGAIDRHTRRATWKGLLMSEIPYEPDFSHMISTALISGDYDVARYLLASGSFGDSLNHAYKSDAEGQARRLLYSFDRSNELNVKAHLLKGYAEDSDGSFVSKLITNGLFTGFVEEAWKNHEAAREVLNDLLRSSKKKPIPQEVVVDVDVIKLKPYLENCLSFERFRPDERNSHDLSEMSIEGQFFARALTINYKRILFDIVGVNSSGKRRHQTRV
ncbi:MAG TPA: helicase-related protein [Candidatus Bathyarchaeia archaeon]|nr:helicase-related protein [Candidatus Bathyarchaeia archaeon]